MTFDAFIPDAKNAIMTLVVISVAGAVFEILDGENESAVFMSGLCAACCILGMLVKLTSLTG